MNTLASTSRKSSRPKPWMARHSFSRNVFRLILFLCLLMGSVWLSAHSALAHNGMTRTVPRISSPVPPPTVDGSCHPTEYLASARAAIPYTPVYSPITTTVKIMSSATDLYVCMSGIPVRMGTTTNPYVALYFDVTHQGGRTPQNDDLRFQIYEADGANAVQRGNGTGYVNAPDITGWEAYRTIGDIFWSAEFRIPLSLLRNGIPGQLIGFTVRHQNYNTTYTDFFWPPSSQPTVPNSWADLVWTASASDNAHLDIYRVTQGVEYDASGSVFYDLVAGKDTLVQAQLYTSGTTRTLNYGACRSQQITRLNSSGVPEPVSGAPVNIRPVVYNPSPTLNTAPNGRFTGAPTINCWLPGTDLAEAGDYRFEMAVRTQGSSTTQTISLGTRRFMPTADLRVYLHRWINSQGSGSRSWGSDLDRNIQIVMLETNRMYSVKSGTGLLNENGLAATLPTGLRYLTSPTVGTCQASDTASECDARSRNEGHRALLDHNARLLRMDQADGQHRDRLDVGSVLVALDNTGGGQSCWAGHRVAGSGFDANISGYSAMVVAHEMNHCLGQVSSISPNSDGSGHSLIGTISLYRNASLANTHLQQFYSTIHSLMFPIVDLAQDTLNQGYEWNEQRNTLLTMVRPARREAALAPQASALFEFAALINTSDILTVTYSARVEDLPLEISTSDPYGSYSLDFFNDVGKTLQQFAFEPDFSAPEGGPGDVTGTFLVVPLPDGSAKMVIRKGANILYEKQFTANPPSIWNLALTPDGAGNFTLTWEASDPDGLLSTPAGPGPSPLRYSVYFAPSAEQPPILLTDEIVATSYTFPTDYAPGATAAQLFVQATDGYNTSEMQASEIFVIPDKLPLATIVYPDTEMSWVEQRPLTLVGSGFDYTTGPIKSEQMEWSSDIDGYLGTGEQLEVALSAGTHTLTLKVTAPSGLSAQTDTIVDVRADSDGDGLSNEYEMLYPCLSYKIFDSDEDPDADGLANLAEQTAGSDPCTNDSDQDSFADGDETWRGSSPMDAESTPPEDPLALDQTLIQLDCSLGNPSMQIAVQTLYPTTVWHTASNTGWLSADFKGTGDNSFPVSIDCTGLAPGLNTGQIIVTAGLYQVRIIDVELLVPNIPGLFLPMVLWAK